jgi:hypothetical protein
VLNPSLAGSVHRTLLSIWEAMERQGGKTAHEVKFQASTACFIVPLDLTNKTKIQV